SNYLYEHLWQNGSDLTFDTAQCPPTLDPVANAFTAMNSEIMVPLNVQSTAGADGVALSAVASNPELISALIFSGSGSSRSLAIGPAMNKRGVTTITITATDSTGTSMRSFGLRIGAAIRGDLNDDMTSDIVWRHSSGTLAIWLMNGTQVIGGGELTI